MSRLDHLKRNRAQQPVHEAQTSALDTFDNHRQSLQRQSDGAYLYGAARLTMVGLELPDDTSERDYEDIGEMLLKLDTRISFAIGDYVNFGDNRKWGETYATIAARFGYKVDTMRSYASVCRNVSPENRRPELTFAHHRAVMGMNAHDQQQWLAAAVEAGLTIDQFRKAIAKATKPQLPVSTLPSWYDNAMRHLENADFDNVVLPPDERHRVREIARKLMELAKRKS